MGLSLAPCRRLCYVSLGLSFWLPHKRFEHWPIAWRRKIAKRSKQSNCIRQSGNLEQGPRAPVEGRGSRGHGVSLLCVRPAHAESRAWSMPHSDPPTPGRACAVRARRWAGARLRPGDAEGCACPVNHSRPHRLRALRARSHLTVVIPSDVTARGTRAAPEAVSCRVTHFLLLHQPWGLDCPSSSPSVARVHLPSCPVRDPSSLASGRRDARGAVGPGPRTRRFLAGAFSPSSRPSSPGTASGLRGQAAGEGAALADRGPRGS